MPLTAAELLDLSPGEPTTCSGVTVGPIPAGRGAGTASWCLGLS
jgi:hypothetical protein